MFKDMSFDGAKEELFAASTLYGANKRIEVKNKHRIIFDRKRFDIIHLKFFYLLRNI
ncbi:hypothetical protein CSCA_2591 [Clostridium scatologenes]|uniref:Uncharacterized protein n=1 Tax=Clostridium scatologenes TaxID=1548 RepID=A0A0E3GR52_CLOSL|nr:hypothetical protein CSCA_2591 [Clostridium scatologenes]